MKTTVHSLFLLLLLLSDKSISQIQDLPGPAKQVSVTVDDLPLNIARHVSNEEMKSIVGSLVFKIRSEGIPGIAFVNENKLELHGRRDTERVNILKTWIDAGIELGNHTYSHKSANAVPVADYEQDILQGERTIKELLTERGMTLRYFRHPFLMTGRSLEVKNEITRFLIDHGYRIAPVTIDNAEWIFSAAYDNARNNNDTTLMKKVGREYIKYMKAKFQYYERQSDSLFGRQIKQILLIHSNRLNSEYFNILCTMMKDLQYRFISLDEALKDHAYSSKDTYTGGSGISWLDRWAISQGKTKDFFANEPRAPLFIMQLAHVDNE
ncbi:MAG: polysaccharide deacetylase [Ignavibacteriae bacterium]|nr:MAG: polysaccharide deacetylase [Ignavibacteriota bacterium]